jgi:hypothetical protein
MSVQDTRNKPDEMGTSAALLDETCAVIVSFQKCENPLSRGNCFDVSIQKGDEPSSDNVCAQCSAGGDDIPRHGAVWLHPECVRFWSKSALAS